MPLRFIVDPELPANVRTVSLSYTFFQAKPEEAGSEISMGSGTLDSIM